MDNPTERRSRPYLAPYLMIAIYVIGVPLVFVGRAFGWL